MYLADMITLCVKYPEMMGENYDEAVVKQIVRNPIAWLNSLPMYEYAHVLVTYTAHHLGGNPEKYVKILYNNLLSPILTRYYQELELYRMKRAAAIRKYYPTMKIAQGESHVILKDKMGICTGKIRAMLRKICDGYTYLAKLDETDPEVQLMMQKARAIAADTDLYRGHSELNTLVNQLKQYTESQTNTQS